MKYFIIIAMLSVTGCGKTGSTGAEGPAGSPGQSVQGPAGAPGSNGESFTPVQLCRSCVTQYPDTYAEVVFCYQGDLYGTYSANDGFSAELPPGTYNSAGINCSCTVTIGTNCNVTDN